MRVRVRVFGCMFGCILQYVKGGQDGFAGEGIGETEGVAQDED